MMLMYAEMVMMDAKYTLQESIRTIAFGKNTSRTTASSLLSPSFLFLPDLTSHSESQDSLHLQRGGGLYVKLHPARVSKARHTQTESAFFRFVEGRVYMRPVHPSI
jgi:hypothetical protein